MYAREDQRYEEKNKNKKGKDANREEHKDKLNKELQQAKEVENQALGLLLCSKEEAVKKEM